MREPAALTRRLVAALTALAASACGHHEPLVTQITADRIAECGGGLHLSSNLALGAAISKELRGGRLSASAERNLEAAFIQHLGRESYEAVEIFKMYSDCIEGQDNLQLMVSAINARAPKLDDFFRSKHVPEDEIHALKALESKEVEQIQARQFLAARDTRSAITKSIIRIAIGHGIDPTTVDYTLSVNEPKSAAEEKAEQDKAWEDLRTRTMNACRLYASAAECAERVPTEILMVRISRSGPSWDDDKPIDVPIP